VKALAVALAVLLLAPLGAAAQGQRTASRPYALHEIRLGMTLSEFRELERWHDAQAEQKELVCSGDEHPAVVVIRPTPDVNAAGAIRCAVVKVESAAEQRYSPALVEFFGERGDVGFIFYQRSEDTELRLTQINLFFDNKVFQTILNLFRRAYGPPSDFDISALTTLFGATLANSSYSWDNRVSSIRMDTFSVTIERMSVMFAHNELFGELGPKIRRMRDTRQTQ
jgi:hypothetical protein